MESENITVATANAQRGHMIRSADGLSPFRNTDVLLLSEVKPRRDNLKENLEKGGFQLAYADNLDLAIAVKEGYKVISAKEYPLTRNGPFKRFLATNRMGRLFGLRNMIVAEIETPTGEKIKTATLHPVTKPFNRARREQVKAMGRILENFDDDELLVIGADFNHRPGPEKADIQVREQNKLSSVDLQGKETFIYRLRGQLDDMLYRGKGIQSVNTEVVDIQSDHRAIITTFRFQKAHIGRTQQVPQRELALAA